MKIALKFSKERNDNTMISVEVSELTKEYAVVNGEKIEFDQPWEETPNREELEPLKEGDFRGSFHGF